MPGSNLQAMQALTTEVDAFATAAFIFAAQSVIEINNEGGGGAPPAPIDTGELRGSPRITMNAPSFEGPDSAPFGLISSAEVASAFQLQGFSLGDLIFITWIAEHAPFVQSDQAPQGWVEPAAEATAARIPSWEFGAVR